MRSFFTLKKTREFQQVFTKRTSFANRLLIMYVLKNPYKESRLGISVSKKVGNSVVRHRITRQLREIFRLNQDKIDSSYDLVVVVRDTVKGKSYAEIESAFLHLLKLHRINKNL